MARIVLLVVLLACTAFAQDGGAGVLTRAPTIVTQVDPAFPAELLDAGVGGDVTMEIDLGPDGRVMDARVVQSAGEAFDREALAAMRQFVFTPAEVDGQPAAVRLAFTMHFVWRAPPEVEAPLQDAGTPVNFRGRVVERGTREALGGAQVVVEGREVITDEAGRFEVSDVPEGTWPVVVIATDFERYTTTETFTAGARTEVTYFVRRQIVGGYQTTVRGAREKKEVAQVTLSQEEIKLIPGTNGDAFRVVQNLPGVARAPFGIGLLVVRGGKPWDTKTYVDEAPVPQLFHFGGLFSTYNANLLENINFQAGNFNADFGRSIGGLITADARTPSKTGYHGYVDVNLVDASALLEGPIVGDWSFAVSARRSYIDAVLPAVLSLIPGAEDAVSFTLAPRYYDYQARVEWRPKHAPKTRFFVSFFGSSDALVLALPNPSIDPEGRGTFGSSVLYNRLLVGLDLPLAEGVAFRTRTSLGIDELSLSVGDDIFAKGKQYPIRSRNTLTVQWPSLRTEVQAGLDLGVQPYSFEVQTPPLPRLNQVPDPFQSKSLVLTRDFVVQAEPGVFAQAVVKPIDALRIVAGVRGDYSSQMNKAWVDPRLAVFFQVHDRVALKGGVGLYHQPPDYRTGQLSRALGNPDLLPEGAVQGMLGTEVRFTDALSLDVQGYTKSLFQQVRQTLAPMGGLDSEGLDLRYSSTGRGLSYGLEILLRHALTKNFFGWVAYSLSRVERDYLGGTAWGLSQFDQPHNLVVVASYKLPFDFIVGAKLRYTSGPLTRPVTAAIYDVNGNYFYPVQGALYTRRLPDFFQLDVRIDKRFVFRDFMFAIYLDVQNATYRQNVEAVLNSYDYSKEAYLTGLPILPVLGLRAEY